MIPSSTELKYFIEVAHTLNLSRASERLGISQPSLSLAIKRLETYVGVPLLSRHKHGVSLTQAGKQLLLHANQLLQYWERTKSQVLSSQNEIRGSFTLGFPSSMASHIVAKFLPDFLEKNPQVEILLANDLSRKIAEGVVNLSIDIGLVANPVKHPDFIMSKLCEDKVSFWKGPGKRNIQDSSEHAILLFNPEMGNVQSLLKQNKKNRVNYRRVLTSNSLEVIANLTASGCGIGILPERVAKSLYPQELKPIPNAPFYKDEIYVIYRQENRNVLGIQATIKALKALFAK